MAKAPLLSFYYWALKKVSPYFRRRRMRRFQRLFKPTPGLRILDLGGATGIWDGIDVPLNITILNLPGFPVRQSQHSRHEFTFLEGDATHLPEIASNSFDLVFSNSVIEHVGDAEKQAAFARECRRLAPGYFVQTPSVWFPWEPHTGLPFWWLMPRRLKNMLHRRWSRTLPDWNEMVAGTTVIWRREMKRYFPDATLLTERFIGIPKSYAAYCVPSMARLAA